MRRISKKKWIFIIVTIFYFVAKIYVAYTPNQYDDQIPDNVRDATLKILAINDRFILPYEIREADTAL